MRYVNMWQSQKGNDYYSSHITVALKAELNAQHRYIKPLPVNGQISALD